MTSAPNMTQMRSDGQDGLEWERGLWSTVPHWTRQPSIPAIENVCCQQLQIPPGDFCIASFHASGAFNKVYRVECMSQSFIMRVTLPVYPYHKTHGEVTTLDWLYHNTTFPVPKVIAFADSRSNEIGFEGILMEFMPGCQARQKWRTMTMEQKVAFTERIAEIQAELFRGGKNNHQFRNIGTLNMTNRKNSEGRTIPIPGQRVFSTLFLDNRLKYDISRGPFNSSYAWLESEIEVAMQAKMAILEETEDEGDKEDAEDTLISSR